jgi:hypothetical protein
MNPLLPIYLKKSVDHHFKTGLAVGGRHVHVEGFPRNVEDWDEWYEVRFSILRYQKQGVHSQYICNVDILCCTKSINSLRLATMIGLVLPLWRNIPVLGEDDTCEGDMQPIGDSTPTKFTNPSVSLVIQQGIVDHNYKYIIRD